MMGQPAEARPSTFRLRRRTPGTFVLVPFVKQGRSIRCQGQLEAATAQIVAGCPLVREIHEQPFSIWYSWSEETRAITLLDGPPSKAFRKSHRCSYIVPDYAVTMHGGAKRLVEVKPSSKLGRPLVERKLSVARRFAAQQGWTFHVVTERELFAGPLLANVRLLNRFRRLSADPRRAARIQFAIAERPTPLGELLQQFATDVEAPIWSATVWHLVAVERLAVDPRPAPLSIDTVLHLGGTLTWDPFDSVWEPSGSSTNGGFASSANLVPINSSPKT